MISSLGFGVCGYLPRRFQLLLPRPLRPRRGPPTPVRPPRPLDNPRWRGARTEKREGKRASPPRAETRAKSRKRPCATLAVFLGSSGFRVVGRLAGSETASRAVQYTKGGTGSGASGERDERLNFRVGRLAGLM
eukprot:1194655-Prorocentrum_minimum.AAC.6